MSFNKVILLGNVGKDPEVRHLESGIAVATFSLATTERYKDRNGALADNTEWHNIVCWRNLAELSEKYVTKGSQLFIEGKIRTRSWTDQAGTKKYTTEIIADNIRLLGKRGDLTTNGSIPPATTSNVTTESSAAISSQPSVNITATEDVDDLPF